MTAPNSRGGFRARVAYAVRAIARGGEDSRAFDSCFEMYDGAAVVCAIMRERPDLAPFTLSPAGLANWQETAARHAGEDLDTLSRRLIRESRASWERQLAEIQGQGRLFDERAGQ